MKAIGVLQARMTSSRLPGKVLAPILGQAMILRQLERVERATRLDTIAVATSIDESDDELTQVIQDAGYPTVRGSLEDVLARYVEAIRIFEPDVVVRLTADCPLSSPQVVDTIVQAFLTSNADYASNTLVRTFPDGLDVEAMRVDAILSIADQPLTSFEREHVTPGIYRRPHRFKLVNVVGKQDLSRLRWTVDTAEDLEFVREIYEALYPEIPDFEASDILGWLDQNPGKHRIADPPTDTPLIEQTS